MGFVIPAGDHFERNGELWVPVGHAEEPPILASNQDEYFRRMADHGENVLRLQLEPVPFECYTEPTSKLESYLAPIAEAASKHNVLLFLETFFPHSIFYKQHPFYKLGMATSYNDLFNEKCELRLRERLEFIVDRFEPILFGLELWTEATERRDDWIDRMARFCASITEVMCSVSTFPHVGTRTWGQWCNPNLDYVSVHTYSPNGGLCIPAFKGTGVVNLAARLANLAPVWKMVKAKASPGKPILDTETPSVPIDVRKFPRLQGVTVEELETSFFEVAMAYKELGAAGPGIMWSSAHLGALDEAGRPNALSPGMYAYQEQIAELWK